MAMVSSLNLCAAKRRAAFSDIPQRSAISRMEWAERGRPPPCLRRGLIAISIFRGRNRGKKEGSAGEEGTLLKHNYFCHSYDLTKSKYAPTLGHAQDHMHYFYYFVRNKKGRIGATFVYVTLGVIYPAMRRFQQPGETL